MKVFKVILLALVFITLQAHAKDDGRNLVVKQNSSAGKRIALVIGNGNYQNSDSLPKLANPTHDAEDIAAALRSFGFEVIEKKDQSLEGMSDAITEFSRKIGDSEAALFYFAGHGLQVKGQNYIIPIDAKIETEAQVPFKSINVNLILEEMDNGQSRANIVMLDACRNNPISGKFRSGGTRGLAAISSQPKGTVIVYATDPGNVAADGTGRNGLFTAGLLTAFKGNDLSLGGVLTRASEEVERGSEKKQTPYVNGPMTLQKSFQFGQGTQVASLVPVPTQAQPAAHVKSREEIEQDGWEGARDSANIDAIQEYLKQYPKGRFAGQAKILMATLKTAPTKPTVPIITPVREDGENNLWTEVQKGNSKDDYDAYLAQYPKGKYVALAKSRIKKLQDEAAAEASRKEQDAWETADQSGSETGYQSYLKGWPAGRYAGLAQVRLRKLQTDLAAQRKKEASAMLGEWKLEYVSTGGCRYKEAVLAVSSKTGDEDYQGQLSFLDCSVSHSAIIQDALIRINGSDVKIIFSNPRRSDGSTLNYSPDNFVLERKSAGKLIGFNKDSNGRGKEVILIRN